MKQLQVAASDFARHSHRPSDREKSRQWCYRSTMATSLAYERLEPSRETQELWLATLARFVLSHLEGLESGPAAGPIGPEAADVAASVTRPIGEEPLPGAI